MELSLGRGELNQLHHGHVLHYRLAYSGPNIGADLASLRPLRSTRLLHVPRGLCHECCWVCNPD